MLATELENQSGELQSAETEHNTDPLFLYAQSIIIFSRLMTMYNGEYVEFPLMREDRYDTLLQSFLRGLTLLLDFGYVEETNETGRILGFLEHELQPPSSMPSSRNHNEVTYSLQDVLRADLPSFVTIAALGMFLTYMGPTCYFDHYSDESTGIHRLIIGNLSDHPVKPKFPGNYLIFKYSPRVLSPEGIIPLVWAHDEYNSTLAEAYDNRHIRAFFQKLQRLKSSPAWQPRLLAA